MKNTNFQNLRELLKSYIPKTFGIATVEEYSLIKSRLQLEVMEIIDLRNLRDFVVLFFSRKNEDKLDMADMNRMSAITAVIDKEIIERGGEV